MTGDSRPTRLWATSIPSESRQLQNIPVSHVDRDPADDYWLDALGAETVATSDELGFRETFDELARRPSRSRRRDNVSGTVVGSALDGPPSVAFYGLI
jgi:hypothetical protein